MRWDEPIPIETWNATRSRLAAPLGCFPFHSHRPMDQLDTNAARVAARPAMTRENFELRPRSASGPKTDDGRNA